MSQKIEKVLKEMGHSSDNIPEIIKAIPNKVGDFIDSLSTEELHDLIATLNYIYIAQNIRDEGVLRSNCKNENSLFLLTQLGFIEDYKWHSHNVVRTLNSGTNISNKILEIKIKEIQPNEFIKFSRLAKIILLNGIKNKFFILPIELFDKDCFESFFIAGKSIESFIIRLPYCSDLVFSECKLLADELVRRGMGAIANYYVSSHGGRVDEKLYVFSEEMVDALKVDMEDAYHTLKNIESFGKEMEIKYKAIKFLQQYNSQKYEGIGEERNSSMSIIDYLKRLGNCVFVSKEVITTGFGREMPFIIKDDKLYRAGLQGFKVELINEIEKELERLKEFKPEPIKIKPAVKGSKEQEPQPVTPLHLVTPSKPILVGSDGIIIGSDKITKQYGVIGRSKDGKAVILDLNAPHVAFVCGKMGSGKGYIIGVICEMIAHTSIDKISSVENPATIVVFHKPKEKFQPSEFGTINQANDVNPEIVRLSEYNLKPMELFSSEQVKIFLDPTAYLHHRKKFCEEYSNENVFPIAIDPTSLDSEDWRLALTVGNTDANYVDRIYTAIRKLYGKNFGIDDVRKRIFDDEKLDVRQKNLADGKLEAFEEYFSDSDDFINRLAIGGINIFDFRQAMYKPDKLFSIMTMIVSKLQNREKLGNSPFVFVINEAHTYLSQRDVTEDFVDEFINIIRRKRFGGNWLLLDTHEPNDIHPKLLTLSDIKVIHHSDITISSRELSKILQDSQVEPKDLKTGQAIICADESSLGNFKPILVNVRPRITKHGAPTKVAK